MKWHPSLAKAGHNKSFKCYDILTKYVVPVKFYFDYSISHTYRVGMERRPTG